MAQSEIITRMKKRQLKRKAFSFSKYLIVIGIIVYGGYLYKGEKSFLDIKNDILSYFPKDNRDRINVKQVKATLTSISKTNDNSNRRKKISSENQKKDNFADKNKEIDLKIKTKIKEKTANINKEENKTLSTVIVKNETENIVDDYKNSILPHDFQYGKENEVLDYSWNIDIEPYEISNKLRTYRNKNRENKSPEWEYMTDNLSYYTKNISQIKPDYSIPNISYVYSEWNYNIDISPEKILGGLLNGMPYKFFNIKQAIIPKKARKPSFETEIKLAITYAPKMAVPLAEIDLLLSNTHNLTGKIERLAFAYYRAGEKKKLENLLNKKLEFKYPNIKWGGLDKFFISSSFGIKDNFGKYKNQSIRYRSYKKNKKLLEEFNSNISLKQQRDFYLALIKGKQLALKSSYQKLERMTTLSKKDKVQIDFLYNKKENTISIGLKEKELLKLSLTFDNLIKRFSNLNLKIVERYKNYSNEDMIAEVAHLNKMLGRLSFFTIDSSLYLMNERKISNYIATPQDLLFSTIQLYREYKKQKYRAIPMLFWVQKSGMNSPQKKNTSLYHDYFNAAEASIYLHRFTEGWSRQFLGIKENYKYLEKLTANAVKLSHDPLAKKYFKSLWTHRFMTLFFMWLLNSETKHLDENIYSATRFLENFSGKIDNYDKQYYNDAKEFLVESYIYSSNKRNFNMAKKLSFERIEEILPHQSLSDICADLLRIANITKDTGLWDNVIKITKNNNIYNFTQGLLRCENKRIKE